MTMTATPPNEASLTGTQPDPLSSEPLLLHPGAEVVPGYRLVRPIGRGGFGEVWEARAPGDFPVALKFISLDTGRVQPELRALQILRSLRHPHLLDVQWALPVGDRLVIAMPLCDKSLKGRFEECVARGLPGIPHEELLGYVAEAALALDFLNEPHLLAGDGRRVGVQHRDIKPHNIFLVGGSARVADFGLAKILETSVAEHSGSMTMAYAPPEFFRQKVTPTSDQYSLAVTYAHLRCGHLPFGGTLERMLHAILHEEPNLRALPDAERPAVARALAKDPEQRWPSCREFVSALRAPPAAPRPLLGRGPALQALAREVRAKTLQLLVWSRREDLLWAPPGTANHILWHAGHAVWVQDALCIQIATGKSHLPPGWEEMFGMGSRPSLQQKPWPDVREVKSQLEAQLPRWLNVIGAFDDDALDRLPPHPHGRDTRTLGECILHGAHDEANHQGEMYLLLKMRRLGADLT
jgi:serine/threonine protein kinase